MLLWANDRGAKATISGRAGGRLMSGRSNFAELFPEASGDGGLRENIFQTVYVSRSAIGMDDYYQWAAPLVFFILWPARFQYAAAMPHVK